MTQNNAKLINPGFSIYALLYLSFGLDSSEFVGLLFPRMFLLHRTWDFKYLMDAFSEYILTSFCVFLVSSFSLLFSSGFLMACNFPSGRVKPHFPVRFLISRLPPSRLLQVLPALFYTSLNPSPTVSHMLSSRSCSALAVSFRCGIWISNSAMDLKNIFSSPGTWN